MIDDLKAGITAGCDGPGFWKLAEWCTDLLEHFGSAEAIVINEEEAAGLGACDDADRYGTAGNDLGLELLPGERFLLPFGLVGALVVTNGD